MPENYGEYLTFLRVCATIVIFEMFFVTITLPVCRKQPVRIRVRTTRL